MNKTISLSELNQILMQFGQNIGLRNLSLGDKAATSLVFDDQFLVELQGLDREGDQIRTLYLLTVLSPMPQHANERASAMFYQQLLKANLSGAAMGNVFFAIDPENQDILLVSALSAHLLTSDILENEMEKFVNVLENWAGTLKGGMLDISDDDDEVRVVDNSQDKDMTTNASSDINTSGAVRI